MPDGDKINDKFTGKYGTIYKQLCEEYFSEEDLAYEALIAVKDDLQKHSYPVIALIDKFATRCDQLIADLETGTEINWDKEALLIEKQAQRMFAQRIVRDLTERACKEQLQEIRYGIYHLNFPVEIMRKYMWNLYEKKFHAKVLLIRKHYNDADEAFVHTRLETMRGYVWEYLLGFARQGIRHKSFDSLRRSGRHRQRFDANNLDVVLD